MPPTSDELRRHFTNKLERATFQVQQAEREAERHSKGPTAWVSFSFWRGVQMAWEEALKALDGIPEDA